MNAANNLALAPRGTTVVNHDNKAMNEQATKQDLHNQGIQIDSEFVKVDSQLVILRNDMNAGFDRVDGQFTNLRTDMDAKFANVDNQITNLRTDTNAGFDKVYSRFEIVDSQFANLRTDMDAKFDKAQVALNKTLLKFGSLYFTLMFAVLSIERWWR